MQVIICLQTIRDLGIELPAAGSLQPTRFSLRRFLPTFLKHIQLGARPTGEPVGAGFDWLRIHELLNYLRSEQTDKRWVVRQQAI
jgi:hypothetical protein